MTPSEVEALIRAGIPGCRVHVHSEDDTHFEAVVVSSDFSGKPPLQRHRMVNRTLGNLVGGEIHALSIQALTPEEEGGASGLTA